MKIQGFYFVEGLKQEVFDAERTSPSLGTFTISFNETNKQKKHVFFLFMHTKTYGFQMKLWIYYNAIFYGRTLITTVKHCRIVHALPPQKVFGHKMT